MGLQALSSRAIIGSFYKKLFQDNGASWTNKIAMNFASDQASETYKWLGQVPVMREWLGGRQAKGFFSNGITIENKEYESTLEVPLKDLRRDKTGQTMVRISEQARRANSFVASKLSTKIIEGASALCYDGQFFFDTDHKEGNNVTNQSNDLSIDISTLPVAVHGSTTVPSPEELVQCVLQGVQAIYGFKDNENEPMNEDSSGFVVMVPTSLWALMNSAVGSLTFGGGSTNPLSTSDFDISVVVNPRLDATWTEQFAIFRDDGSVKPFIVQTETPISMKAKAEGSGFEYDKNAWSFGIDASMGFGYGYWQHACLVTMV